MRTEPGRDGQGRGEGVYDKGVKWFPVVPHGLAGREGMEGRTARGEWWEPEMESPENTSR